MIYSPFNVTEEKGNNFSVSQKNPITFIQNPIIRLLVFVNSGIGIFSSYFHHEKPLFGTEKEIIDHIHRIRYSQRNPYLITGGHFHQLYVRNLGIFFNAILDPRIHTSKDDWINRQAIVLKTIHLDLELSKKTEKDFTTFIPLSKTHFTALNIYSRPSDSLFSMLFTLHSLTNPYFITNIFPAKKKINDSFDLMTITSGKKLIETYSHTLASLVKRYLEDIIDKSTGLINTKIYLASARDGIKRQSSFYDNVIAWSTKLLASDLGLISFSNEERERWKDKIIKVFWNESEQIFLDDLSPRSMNEKIFSADSFIVTSSKFLSMNSAQDKRYLQGMIRYVKNHKLDSPFPLHYSINDNINTLHWPVRFFAPSYMGKSIWSHWGIEYIKSLQLLGLTNPKYLIDAKKHIKAYKRNILASQGYPELYNWNGTPFSNRVYKSVLHNGWVINYEQAKLLMKYS